MRAVLTTAGVLAAVWLVLVVLAWVFQRQLIYLPDRSAPTTPAGVEEVTLTTADGLELTSWYLAAGTDAASTVLVTPGNAGNRALRLPLARGLTERGHHVLLLEYRGYGGNPGRPGEEALIRDAVAAWEHLHTDRGVEAGQMVVLGESIGTGVAAGLVAQREAAAIVLRSPFPALADVASGHYPFLPVRTLLRDRFPVVERLREVDAPILVVAGGADGIVPTALSREVAQVTGARYVELPGVDHNDRELLDGADYLDAVDAFVREVAGDR